MKITYSEMQRKFSESKYALYVLNIPGDTIFGDLDKQISRVESEKKESKRIVFTVELDEKPIENKVIISLVSYNVTKENNKWMFEKTQSKVSWWKYSSNGKNKN